MERQPKGDDPEAAVARALRRSFARQRVRENLNAIGILLAGILALIAIGLVLKTSYYLVVATQIVLPWLLCSWLGRKDPAWIFISWMWSAIASYFLLEGYFGYAALVDRTTAIVAAGAVGGILFAAVGVHRPAVLAKSQRPLAFFVFVFLWVYSYACFFEVNCLLDRSPITVHRTVVLDKVYGFRGARGLLVHSWSPDQHLSPASLLIRRGASIVPPSRELFRAVRKGDTICVVQREGRLGMSWYITELESWNGRPVALGPWGGRF